jgi:hypothetical protein
MVVHGDKVAQLAVHGKKVPIRCSSWGQKVVSPIYYVVSLLIMGLGSTREVGIVGSLEKPSCLVL